MAQFQIYQSTDAGAPIMNWQSNSFVNVLDACLVNGYGSKVAAGWTKPFANVFPGGGWCLGAYTQPTGSRKTLLVRDNINLPELGACSSAQVSASVFLQTGSFSPVTMYISKINSDGITKDWMVFADSQSLYVYIKVNFSALFGWSAMAFGDYYVVTPKNIGSCSLIIARTDVAQTSVSGEALSIFGSIITSAQAGKYACNYQPTTPGSPNSYFQMSFVGDYAKGGSFTGNGNLAFPNLADNGLYISPLWIGDPTNTSYTVLMGKLRGFYQVCHASTGFADAMEFSGSGDYAGRTFRIIYPVPNNNSTKNMYCMETSDTLDTN